MPKLQKIFQTSQATQFAWVFCGVNVDLRLWMQKCALVTCNVTLHEPSSMYMSAHRFCHVVMVTCPHSIIVPFIAHPSVSSIRWWLLHVFVAFPAKGWRSGSDTLWFMQVSISWNKRSRLLLPLRAPGLLHSHFHPAFVTCRWSSLLLSSSSSSPLSSSARSCF